MNTVSRNGKLAGAVSANGLRDWLSWEDVLENSAVRRFVT
jgi:hypothetical protein